MAKASFDPHSLNIELENAHQGGFNAVRAASGLRTGLPGEGPSTMAHATHGVVAVAQVSEQKAGTRWETPRVADEKSKQPSKKKAKKGLTGFLNPTRYRYSPRRRGGG